MKYIAKFSGFAIAVSVLLFSACSNPVQTQEATKASEEVNDTNTPLHLMQPDYDTPYCIPQTADVKAVMDRVLGYISEGMPAQYDDSLRLVRGRFRLTSYECGVAYSAALAAYKATGDEAYLRFVTDRANVLAELAPKVADKLAADPKFDSEMRRVLRPAALDDCGAMAASFIRLQMEGQKSEAYDPLIARYMDFIVNKEYRLPDGTYARNRPHHNTVWLDDMYMAIPALAWYGSYTGDARYTNEAVRQLHLFKDKMWVPEVKLFRHGWVEGMNPHPNFHWGRCNGWAILTMCEVLDNLPANHKERPFVLDLLRQHIEGLCRLQHQTGLWHQLLDRDDTYLESSCTAIYTYCIAHAINEGWVDPLAYGAQVLLAWNAVTTCVNELGQVEKCCVGTGMGFDPAFYAYRPVHVMAFHGYGPTLWAGAEVIRMLQTTWPKMNDSAVHFYPKEQKTNEPIFSEDVSDGEIFG